MRLPPEPEVTIGDGAEIADVNVEEDDDGEVSVGSEEEIWPPIEPSPLSVEVGEEAAVVPAPMSPDPDPDPDPDPELPLPEPPVDALQALSP